jgi:CRISPR/Cas system-associated endonuclease/helicase Cas3
VKEQWDKWGKLDIDGPQKVIVFVNTVERAIQVYDELKNLFSYPNGTEIILAHSRFKRDDRRIIEYKLSKLFGKNADPKPAILVTTQVAEAGLNISAPLVITELCPMDSLIQRAGRCQRFNPDGTPECEGKRRKGKESKGKVIVVKPAEDRWYFPYNDKARLVKRKKVDKKGKRKTNVSEQLLAIEFTQVVLEMEAQEPLLLNWQKEEELINKALDRLYAAYLSGTTDVEFSEGEEPYISLFRKHQSKKQKAEEEEEESQSEGEE